MVDRDPKDWEAEDARRFKAALRQLQLERAAASDLADALEELVEAMAPSGYTRTWEKAKAALRKAGRPVKGESDAG